MSIDGVGSFDGFPLVGNLKDLALLSVELHQPLGLPDLESIKIFLKTGCVLRCDDGSVDDTVIGEQPCSGGFDAGRKVIDEDEEE